MKDFIKSAGHLEAKENLGKVGIYLGAVLLFGGAMIVKKRIFSDHFYTDKFSKEQKVTHFILSLMALFCGGMTALFSESYIQSIGALLVLVGYWYLGFSLGLVFVPSIYRGQLHKQIDGRYCKDRITDFSELECLLLSKEHSPIGVSLTTKRPVLVDSKKRTEHLMITGSSGQRKSSAAISLRRSDYINGRAVIDVDPKGDREDVETIKEFVHLCGRSEDFQHFNVSDPLNSWGYDPLELGSKRSKVDKIIYALDLQHEHYAGIAEEMLTLIFDVADVTDTSVTLYSLSTLLISKESMVDFYEQVYDLPESPVKKDLMLRISATKNLKSDDLKGIKSKLISLGSLDLKPLLSPDHDRKISLAEVIEKNRIAYFELNTLEFKNLNRVIARFIMSDLGIVASQKSSGTLKNDKDFVTFYLEEALSFIDQNFPEFLRMIRSAGVSMTLIFQTLAKLDTDFGPSFKSELLNDVKTSLHFAASDDIDIETITLIPGTLQTISRSFALDSGETLGYSGRGTEFEKTEKKIQSNLPRELREGQCLFYDKSNKYYDVIESWSSKVPGQKPKSVEQLREIYEITDVNEKPKSVIWSDQELLLGRINPKNWHSFLSYSEIAVAEGVMKRWQESRKN